MSPYSINVRKILLNHKDGTKAYKLIVVTSDAGPSLLIRQYGKVGRLNQKVVQKFATNAAAIKAFDSMFDEKTSTGKGYFAKDLIKNIECSTPEELRDAIGRTVFPTIGSDAINHIDPNYDTTGVRDPEATVDDEGNFIGGKPRIDNSFLEAQKKAEEDKRVQEQRKADENYKNNPIYGAF